MGKIIKIKIFNFQNIGYNKRIIDKSNFIKGEVDLKYKIIKTNNFGQMSFNSIKKHKDYNNNEYYYVDCPIYNTKCFNMNIINKIKFIIFNINIRKKIMLLINNILQNI